MAQVGADLETMRSLHRGLDQHAQQAIEMKTGLDRQFDQTVWTGVNADRMRQAWAEFKPHLDKLHAALTEAKDDVRTQHNDIAGATGESVSI